MTQLVNTWSTAKKLELHPLSRYRSEVRELRQFYSEYEVTNKKVAKHEWSYLLQFINFQTGIQIVTLKYTANHCKTSPWNQSYNQGKNS